MRSVTRQTAARYQGALRRRNLSRRADERFAGGVPERLTKLRDMARAAYAAGTVNILVLLDAVRAQTELELESLSALEAWLHADAEARMASGSAPRADPLARTVRSRFRIPRGMRGTIVQALAGAVR